MRKTARAVVGILAVLLVAAGCGGDSDETSSTTVASTSPATTTTSPPTSDPRSATELASDKAEAERVVLRLTDLPAGQWTGQRDPGTDSPAEDAAAEEFGECLGADPSLLAGDEEDEASAESDDFEDEENRQVSNSVTLISSPERAKEELAAIDTPEAPQCFETFITAAVTSAAATDPPPAGVTFGTVQVDPLSLPGLRTESLAYRAVVPISAEGQTVDSYFDLVLALKGRTAITMTFIGLGGPFPADLETSLTNKLIDRAPAD